MIGGLSLATVAATSGGATSVDLNPGLTSASVGEFLVGLTMVAPTDRAASMMVNVTKLGTGITTPEQVFRTRHIQRKIWTIQDWYTSQFYNPGPNQTTVTWIQGASTFEMPVQRWGNPFTKPRNWSTASAVVTGSGVVAPFPLYLDEALSTAVGDRYVASSGVTSEPDPIFFTCSIRDGQYLRFEIKYFEDDPFVVDPTTPVPTLSDVIPTTTGPGASEVEVSSSTGRIDVWMLRV
jgi:hypothetical protein